MDMNMLPSSLNRTFDVGSQSQDIALIPVSGKASINLPTNLASGSTIYHRRRQQLLIVISCLTLTFTGCGINFAFGVYQEFYQTLRGPFKDASPGEIDLIGTLSASLMTISAPLASAWTKTYGPRNVAMIGGVLFVISSMGASFGTQLWHFLLTQGIIQGWAACLTYIPAITVSPAFFNERRGLAMGIITSGTGLGGMAWAPFLRYLITAIGFRNTLRVTGITAAAMIAMSAFMLRDVEEPILDLPHTHDSDFARHRSNLPAVNWKIVRSREFVAHASGTAIQAAAYMTPVYFMSSYARTLEYSNTAGANIIALSNGCNSGGKIIIGYLADRFGRLNALVLSTLVSAAATFGLCYISNAQMNIDTHRVLFIVYVCIYGITAGAYVSLFPTALAEQFGVRNYASINGLLYMIRGIGTLVGTPVGGALVRENEELGMTTMSFDRTFLFVGILLSGATISVAWARCMAGRQVESEWRA
jgi:MFS family permease